MQGEGDLEAELMLEPQAFVGSDGLAVILGELVFHEAMQGVVSVEAVVDEGWESVAVLEEPGGEGVVPLRLNVTAPQDADEGDSASVVVVARVDGRVVAQSEVVVEVAPVFRLPPFISWDRSELEIVIVPPAHGPIVSLEEGVLPEGPEGALPGGAYLAATLHVLEDWRWALDRFAENHTELAWVANITWDVRIFAEDVVTQLDVAGADIVKFYTESTAAVLGAAVYTGGITEGNPHCVAYSTKWTTFGSLSYKDMYKLAGHELGHCLGPGHTQNDEDGLDIMTNGGYPQWELRCPSNLNVLAVAAGFAPAFGATGPEGTVEVPVPLYERYCSPHSDPR